MSLLTVAILAGGLAKRLGPITEKIPKALINVAGKPFIHHQLDYLKKQGIKRVVICIGHHGKMIQELVADGRIWEIEVLYSDDSPNLLGTGGALRLAQPLLGENFFILYGDSYLPINFRAVQDTFMSSSKPCLMTIVKNENRWDKSNIIYKDGKIIIYDKNNQLTEMNYIDYGLGILNTNVLNNYEKNKPIDLGDIYQKLSLNKQMVAHEVFSRFYEIGSEAGIKETELLLINKGKS